jgi:hypothetical protein
MVLKLSLKVVSNYNYYYYYYYYYVHSTFH